jgi:topoisomerase-4 subunit A
MSEENAAHHLTDDKSGVSGQYQTWFLEYASYVILERAVPALEMA